MALQVEWTDTFGGEANYCWVKRAHIANPDGLSDRAIVRRVKAWAGLTGHPCDTRCGDAIEIRPRGICQVIFASYCPDEYVHGDAI